MIRILDFDRPDLLAYRASGVISEEDVQTATDAFDAILDTHDTVHLYAEIEEMEGFQVRALWLDFVYGLRRVGALRYIGRVALVTDAGWVRRLARLEARLLPIGRLNVYRPVCRDKARAWVLDTPTASVTRGAPDVTTSGGTRGAFGDLDAWIERGGLGAAWADAAWFDDGGYTEALDDDLGAAHRAWPHAPRFGHTVHRTHVLLNRIAEELGTPGTAPAYHALRSVLHALRDHLPAAEAADLAAQLTTIVRGVFYEGYHPTGETEKASRRGFLEAVASGLHGEAPFGAQAAVGAVGRALAESVSEGEWEQVLGALPHDIRALFEVPVGA